MCAAWGVQLGFSQASLEGTASEEWWREGMWEIFEQNPQSYSPTATDMSKCMASFFELLWKGWMSTDRGVQN